ncbi:MAG: response regulator transcription factor [Clostridia bacterium]|nr:response regulator transcription factor [Clostridia bacterium]
MNILIVEDERPLAEALSEILKNAGHFTDIVGDGVEALDYAEGFRYDLVILDVMLPRLNGFSVVSAMREHGNATPVLMLTARTTVPDKVQGLNSGADDYMTKPFDPAELLARVNAMTRRTGTVVMNTLSFGDLTLELDSGALRRGEDSVQLSRKELEVARLLLANPSMTVTKETLIVNVWGIESEATDNNVEAYISFLRKKLKYLKSAVTIKNIQRIGYRLEVEE